MVSRSLNPVGVPVFFGVTSVIDFAFHSGTPGGIFNWLFFFLELGLFGLERSADDLRNSIFQRYIFVQGRTD